MKVLSAAEDIPSSDPSVASERWPYYAEDEIEAVTACLRAGTVNQWTGPQVAQFERSYAAEIGVAGAIALANGSLALELALKAFGIGPGDEVIVTPRSFVASVSCVSLVGATPVFVDVDRDSGAITAANIAGAISAKTRAIIPVHLGGWPADMPAILDVARGHDLKVIEDCAQAHGAAINGRPVGSFGDAAAFSFCQDKIITTGGEGGMVAFQNEADEEWARSFKDHGKNLERLGQPAETGAFRWLHDRVGTNWRMTSLSAAIGIRQLEKLATWRSIRERNARAWRDALEDAPGIYIPWPGADIQGAFYKFYAFVNGDGVEAELRRDAVLRAATAEGIRIFSGSCSEVYREKAFADLKVETLPVAQELGRTSLMLEVHPTLDFDRLRQRADKLAKVMRSILR